jgi:hypothetical protein
MSERKGKGFAPIGIMEQWNNGMIGLVVGF